MSIIRNFAALCAMVLCLISAGNVAAQTPPGSGPKPQPHDPAKLVQAQSLLSAGKLDEAIAILTALPKSIGNELQINYLLGLAHYQKGGHRQAIEYLSQAVKQAQEGSPQHRQAVQFLGMSYYLSGQIKEAIPYLAQIKNWAPDNVEMAYVLGVSYIKAQDPDGAREAFARMFGVPADSAPAYLMNAQMMIRQQVEALAEKELQKALALDPKLPQANFLLGELLIYRAEIVQGIEYLKKEIALNPAFAMPYYMLGEAYTRQQKWDEAIAPLQKSIWLNPFFSGPFIVLGKVYLKKGDLPNAESILRRALRMDPNNFSGHHLLAQVLQQMNRPEEAKKEFEIADRLRSDTNR